MAGPRGCSPAPTCSSIWPTGETARDGGFAAGPAPAHRRRAGLRHPPPARDGGRRRVGGGPALMCAARFDRRRRAQPPADVALARRALPAGHRLVPARAWPPDRVLGTRGLSAARGVVAADAPPDEA